MLIPKKIVNERNGYLTIEYVGGLISGGNPISRENPMFENVHQVYVLKHLLTFFFLKFCRKT